MMETAKKPTHHKMHITLKLPFGRTERVSAAAGDLAVAYDKLTQHPLLAKQLAPGIECLRQGLASLEAIEKITPPDRMREVLEKIFPPK
jgi:hypothetical protein